jgi:hypothetical protein
MGGACSGVTSLLTGFVTAICAGAWPYRIITFYVGLMLAIFMVRTMKRVIFHEARQYRESPLTQRYFPLVFGEAKSTKICEPAFITCLFCAPFFSFAPVCLACPFVAVFLGTSQMCRTACGVAGGEISLYQSSHMMADEMEWAISGPALDLFSGKKACGRL